jgi:hypothetical protein
MYLIWSHKELSLKNTFSQIYGARRSVVVKALGYKSEGSGFETRLVEIFKFT